MRSILCALGILLLSFGSVMTQQQQPQPDPFEGNMFPPELIMQHQQALGLNEEQKGSIKSEVRKTQTQLTDLQWGLQDEVEKLAALVKQNQVDEGQTLTQLDKVLGIEREIKRTHIGLLIRIKNRLTQEQQARLQGITNKTRE